MASKKYRHTLTVHTGPMKAAKTLHLVQAYLHAQTAKRNIQAFRPLSDSRHTEPVICTRFGNVCVPATLIGQSVEILEVLKPETSLVLLDEVQFFDCELPDVVTKILQYADVVVAGLDLDFRGKPFGAMPFLLAMADTVHKYTPVCDVCGGLARFTQRLTNGKPSRTHEPEVLPEGAVESVLYEARCHRCYRVPR
jgi:thymidine kinase